MCGVYKTPISNQPTKQLYYTVNLHYITITLLPLLYYYITTLQARLGTRLGGRGDDCDDCDDSSSSDNLDESGTFSDDDGKFMIVEGGFKG